MPSYPPPMGLPSIVRASALQSPGLPLLHKPRTKKRFRETGNGHSMVVALEKEAMLTSALCSAGLVALASPFSSGGGRTPIFKRPQGCQGLPRRLLMSGDGLIVTTRQTRFLGWLAQCVRVGWGAGGDCNLALGK